MNKIEIIEVSCPLVNGSLLPFYENSEDDEDNFVAPIREFVSHLDLSKTGKIDIEGNTKSLVINLLQTDDFGAPPRSLAIRFSMNSKVYQISIPFSNSSVIYFDLVED